MHKVRVNVIVKKYIASHILTKNLDINDNFYTNKHMQDCCVAITILVRKLDIASETLVIITIMIMILELALALKLLVTMTILIVKDSNYLKLKASYTRQMLIYTK